MFHIQAIPTADLKRAVDELLWEECQYSTATEREKARTTLLHLRLKLGLDESWQKLEMKPGSNTR